MVFFGYLRKLSSKFKVQETIKLTKELVDQGNNVVVLTEYVDSAKEIAQAFDVLPYIGEERKNAENILFNFADSKSVFVGIGKMAGVGLNGLTKANYIILHDRPWNSTDVEQYLGRIHRQGQKNSVFPIWVQYGVSDDRVDEILAAKGENVEIIINGKRRKTNSLSNVAQDLLREIFNN